LICGYDAIRTLFTDSRTSADDRLRGYPHWNIVLPTLLRRVPTPRLAVRVEELPFKRDTLADGVYELWQQNDQMPRVPLSDRGIGPTRSLISFFAYLPGPQGRQWAS
jgi:hypothetical protein